MYIHMCHNKRTVTARSLGVANHIDGAEEIGSSLARAPGRITVIVIIRIIMIIILIMMIIVVRIQ